MPSASSDGHTPLQFPNAKTKIWPQVTAGCELQVPPGQIAAEATDWREPEITREEWHLDENEQKQDVQ